MKALLLAFTFRQSYHVLRVTKDAGYTVHVLGRDCASGLKHSRFCASYSHLDFNPMCQSIEVALKEIERVIKRTSADVILPADAVATRILAALSDRISIPSYPVPSESLFDQMNNKWDFYKFCKTHDISTPDTLLFRSMTELKQAIAQREIKLPIIVKPLGFSSQHGIHPILGEDDLPILDTLTYAPILAQTYIQGEWVGVNILADHGRLLAHAVQRNLSDRYAFIAHEKLLEGVRRIAEASGFHGAANFDAMQDAATGEIYFLECNPRFWYSIFAANLAGLNFVKAGFEMKSIDPAHPLSIAGVDIFRTGVVFKKWLKLSRLNEFEARTSRYITSDPVGILFEKLPIFDDGRLRGTGSLEEQVAALSALARSPGRDTPALQLEAV